MKDYQNQTPIMISNFTKKFFAKTMLKYNDLRSLDKMYEAHDNARKAEAIMIDNVKRTVENKEKFAVLKYRRF